MPYQDVITPDIVFPLQEGQRGLDIGDVIWVLCGAEMCGLCGLGVLGVGWVWAETVGD